MCLQYYQKNNINSVSERQELTFCVMDDLGSKENKFIFIMCMEFNVCVREIEWT